MKATEGITLSAEYRHNSGSVPKLDFHPRRYDYPQEGYSLMHHDLFKNAKDTSMTNYSKLDLTDKMGMQTVIDKKYQDQSNFVIYTMLKAHNGKYLRVIGDKIYAEGKTKAEDPEVEYDSSYLFKFMKKYDEVRDDWYFEIMNGDLYFKTNPFNYTVELSDREIGDKGNLFQYRINRYDNGDDDNRKLLIYSYMDQPWGEDFDYPITETGEIPKYTTQQFGKTFARNCPEVVPSGYYEHWIPYAGVKRYWSIYDGYKPGRIWDGSTSYKGQTFDALVKCNGIMWKNRRGGQPTRDYPNYPSEFSNNPETAAEYGSPNLEKRIGNPTYINASNNYIFLAENGSEVGRNSILMGYDGKIRWVQYYNDFYDKFFNGTLSPKVVIDDVAPNFLVDVPYETKFDNEKKTLDWMMSTGRQRIDLSQLKNTETPSYRYTIRTKEGGN